MSLHSIITTRIHGRIAKVHKWTGQEWLPYPLAVELKQNYHQLFSHIVTTDAPCEHILSGGDRHSMSTGQFVEPELPEMLTLEMVEGTQPSFPYWLSLSAVLGCSGWPPI
jgi:hypothetical protein